MVSIEILSVELFYILIGAFFGTICLGLASIIIPRILDKLTPKIDESKEIVRGNVAVANYYGQITSAVIIGVSIIIAAAIIAALL